jgi:uncharacterized membrane protein
MQLFIKIVVRLIVIFLLCILAGYASLMGYGALISEPGEKITKGSLIDQGLMLLSLASVATWTAGVISIGPACDAICQLMIKRKSPNLIFLIFAVLSAIPLFLILYKNDIVLVGYWVVLTAALTPPALFIFVFRTFRARKFERSQ